MLYYRIVFVFKSICRFLLLEVRLVVMCAFGWVNGVGGAMSGCGCPYYDRASLDSMLISCSVRFVPLLLLSLSSSSSFDLFL